MTYNICFVNKHSQSSKTQDYSFFSDLPKLSYNPTGSPIYSNVFEATTLSKDEVWSFGITKNVYAWCGTADRKLSAGARVEIDSAKLATLGTHAAPGSVFRVSNKAGRLNLAAQPLAANFGHYAIETKDDVDSKLNFVLGIAATSDDGQLRVLNTLSAVSNAAYDIAPSNKFYIAAKGSSVGAAIDATAVKDAVLIDFSKNAGMYGAIVTHEFDGTFNVEYVKQAEYNAAVETAIIPTPITLEPFPEAETPVQPMSPAPSAELEALRQQVQQMQVLLEVAIRNSAPPSPISSPPPAVASAQLPTLVPMTQLSEPINHAVIHPTVDPYPTKQATTWYKAVLTFRNSPGQSRRRDVRDRLTQHMQARSYTYEGGSIDNNLVAIFSHHAGSYGAWHSAITATEDWKAGFDALPRHLRGFVGLADELSVIRTAEAKGLWRARGETESRVVESQSVSTPNGINGVNGAHRTTAAPSPSARPISNGVNGANGYSSPSVNKSATNGVNGINHDSTAPRVNGVTTNGVKPVTNGLNGKYDYKRAPDTAIEAAKRRARAVLKAEGLDELAVGWTVSGH